MKYETIAKDLGRSALACRLKIHHLTRKHGHAMPSLITTYSGPAQSVHPLPNPTTTYPSTARSEHRHSNENEDGFDESSAAAILRSLSGSQAVSQFRPLNEASSDQYPLAEENGEGATGSAPTEGLDKRLEEGDARRYMSVPFLCDNVKRVLVLDNN